MNNYKKQLNDTGTDIITHCNSIILENNKKIPEVLEKELDRQEKEKSNKGNKNGKMNEATYMDEMDLKDKKEAEKRKLIVKPVGY